MVDSSKLSMEQGKEFLRQCGIPQRDIDLMTEKWVVMASVDVLIRFPLLPGEDPTARCVSNKKYQSAVDRPNPNPQNHGNKRKRKCDNQLMKNVDKKPKAIKKTEGHCIQPPSLRNREGNLQKKKCTGSAKTRDPSEVEEDTRLKCKNCGAFGHIARSRMCPMKCWNEALPVQPLGSNKEKKNLITRKDQELQSSGMFKLNKQTVNERQMQEVLPRKSLSQEFSRIAPQQRMDNSEEALESHFIVRKPSRPLLITMAKKKTSLSPVSIVSPRVKTPDVREIPSCSPSKGPNRSTFESVEAHCMGFSNTPKPNLKNCQGFPPSSKKISPGSVISPTCATQPGKKTPLFIHDISLQRSTQYFDRESKSNVPPVKAKHFRNSKVRIQAPGNKPVKFVGQGIQNHTEKLPISSCLHSAMETLVPELNISQASQFSLTTNERNVQEVPKMNPKKPTMKASAHKQSLHGSSYPRPIKETVSQSTHSEKHNTPISLGVDKDQPGFGISSSSMHKYPPKAKFVTQSDLNAKDSKILGSNITRSVLYEDLLVSSSSEDSDE